MPPVVPTKELVAERIRDLLQRLSGGNQSEFAPENGTSTTVKIDLDATGKGSTSFTVPQSWGAFIVLEHPTSQDLTVAVTNPPTPSAKKSPKKKPPVRGAKKRR